MRDYIAEANRFMYDDNYIVETKTDLKKKIEHAFSMHQAAVKRGDKKAADYWESVRKNANDESRSEYLSKRHSEVNASHVTNKTHQTQIVKAKKLLKYHEENPDATKRGYEYAHDEHKKLLSKLLKNSSEGKNNSDEDIAKLEQHNRDSNRAIKRHTGGIGIKDIKSKKDQPEIKKPKAPLKKSEYKHEKETFIDKSENALYAHDDEVDDSDDYLEAVHKHKYDIKAHQKLHDEVDKIHKSGKEVPKEMVSKLKHHTQKSINVLHRV